MNPGVSSTFPLYSRPRPISFVDSHTVPSGLTQCGGNVAQQLGETVQGSTGWPGRAKAGAAGGPGHPLEAPFNSQRQETADPDPSIVKNGFKKGKNVFYGCGLTLLGAGHRWHRVSQGLRSHVRGHGGEHICGEVDSSSRHAYIWRAADMSEISHMIMYVGPRRWCRRARVPCECPDCHETSAGQRRQALRRDCPT
jgi:hypothetical protein